MAVNTSLLKRTIENYLEKLKGADLVKQAGALSVFMALQMLFLYFILPEGVNKAFSLNAVKLWATVFIAWLLLVFIVSAYNKSSSLTYTNRAEPFIWSDLILLLVPLAPIAQYIMLNQDTLTLTDSFLVFIFFLCVSVVYVYFIPLVFGIIVSRRTVMLLSTSIISCVFWMPSWSLEFHWYNAGDFNKQLEHFFLLFAILAPFYFLRRNLAYALVIAFFFLNLILHFFNLSYGSNDHQSQIKLYGLVNSLTMKNKYDIYLLTYDAYVGNETLGRYGIDNSRHEDFLRKSGFKIYKGIYSIDSASVSSMGRTLDLSTSDDRLAIATSGNNTVKNILDKNGYKTYGIFPGNTFYANHMPSYDVYFPKPKEIKGYEYIIRSVGEGQYRFEIELDSDFNKFFTQRKRASLAEKTSQPKFLYAHTYKPGHSQNSGKCRDNETQLYEDKLLQANNEMKADIKAILDNNKNAIIIINGDHGPYLTKDCKTMSGYEADQIDRHDIQDRFGTFLAIKWPDEAYLEFDDITVLQDIFPAIFSYLYDDRSALNASLEPVSRPMRGVYINDGIVVNGKDNGKPLYDGNLNK